MATSTSGQPVYEYGTPEREGFIAPVFMKASKTRKLERFLDSRIGKSERVFHELVSDRIHIDVYLIPPRPAHDHYTLVTMGMSTLPMSVPKGAEVYRYAELLISLPKDWKLDDESFRDDGYYWPVRTLKFLALFPHEFRTWLGSGHTVPNGNPPAPFHESTGFSGVLLLPTSLYGQCRFCRIGLTNPVYFYALHPLHASEMQFKLENGIGKLLEKFDEARVTEVVDINRRAVV